jgi:hypothetical protein
MCHMFQGMRQRARSIWDPRLGAVATTLWLNVLFAMIMVGLLPVVWAPLIVVGAYTHKSAIWGAGIAAMAIEGILLLVLVQRYRNWRRALRRAFGITLRWNEPPIDEERYLAWCAKKGVSPYVKDRVPVVT